MSGIQTRNWRDGELRRRAPIKVHRNPAILRRAGSAIRRTLRTLIETVAEARRVARACEELAAMSDPELGDMGIARADIPAVASGTYHGGARVIPHPAARGRRGRSPSSDRRDQARDQGASP